MLPDWPLAGDGLKLNRILGLAQQVAGRGPGDRPINNRNVPDRSWGSRCLTRVPLLGLWKRHLEGSLQRLSENMECREYFVPEYQETSLSETL